MITPKSLLELDTNAVEANRAEIVSRVQEANPKLYLRLGVFADLLVHFNAALATRRQDQIDAYVRGRSLLAIEADPELADSDLVDDVLSNFNVTRLPGAEATGDVVVVLSDDITVTIAQGSVWEANGQRFVAPRVYTAKVEAGQVAATGDRLLTRRSDGNWAFTITLTAESTGTAGMLRKDATVVPLVAPQNFVQAYVASDFTGGRAAETNAEILQRLREGVAAKSLGDRTNMNALLRSVEAFSQYTASSIIGLGDAEMIRDRHSILPISLGGRVDWYLRTQERLYRLALTKEATLVEKGTDNRGIWQLSLGRDDAPGFYEIVKIRPTAGNFSGGFTVTADERGLDLTGAGFRPDVATVVEGAYSRFQTAVIRFKDTETNVTSLALGAKQPYQFEALGQPLLGAIQDYLSSRDVRHSAADCLIKAPVPCFVQLSFTIYKTAGEADPDLAAMKTALCTEINTIGFVGRLQASQLYDTIHAYLRNAQTASGLDIFGRVRYPAGTLAYLRSSEALLVPEDASAMVSAKTVQFFADPEDISIAVVTLVPAAS